MKTVGRCGIALRARFAVCFLWLVCPWRLPAPTNNVSFSGNTAYVLGGTNNPTLKLERGITYVFQVNANGHPVYIKTVTGSTGTGNQFTNGVTGNGVENGALRFVVPTNAPNTLFYHCSAHSGMGVGSSRVDLQACKLEYSIVSPK